MRLLCTAIYDAPREGAWQGDSCWLFIRRIVYESLDRGHFVTWVLPDIYDVPVHPRLKLLRFTFPDGVQRSNLHQHYLSMRAIAGEFTGAHGDKFIDAVICNDAWHALLIRDYFGARRFLIPPAVVHWHGYPTIIDWKETDWVQNGDDNPLFIRAMGYALTDFVSCCPYCSGRIFELVRTYCPPKAVERFLATRSEVMLGPDTALVDSLPDGKNEKFSMYWGGRFTATKGGERSVERYLELIMGGRDAEAYVTVVGGGQRLDPVVKKWGAKQALNVMRDVPYEQAMAIAKRSHACLPPGSLVWSGNGLTPIESLQVGDQVLGHDGGLHRVEELGVREVDEPVVEFDTYGGWPVRATSNHPVLATRVSALRCGVMDRGSRHEHVAAWGTGRLRLDPGGLQREWVPVGDLQVGDIVWSPIPRGTGQVASVETPRDDVMTTQRLRGTRIYGVAVTPGLLRFLGYFLSEGSATRSQMGGRRVDFCFHHEEVEFQQDVLELGRALFGLTGKVRRSEFATHVIFENADLCRLMRKLGGHRAENKRILPELFWSDHDLSEVLVGAWRGDGSKPQGRQTAYVTVSKALADQIRILLLRRGIVPSLQYRPADKSSKRKQATYHLVVSMNQREQLCRVMGWRMWGPAPLQKKPLPGIVSDKYVGYAVRRIDRVLYAGSVHNLHVADANSYVGEGAIAWHNSIFYQLNPGAAAPYEWMYAGVITLFKRYGFPEEPQMYPPGYPFLFKDDAEAATMLRWIYDSYDEAWGRFMEVGTQAWVKEHTDKRRGCQRIIALAEERAARRSLPGPMTDTRDLVAQTLSVLEPPVSLPMLLQGMERVTGRKIVAATIGRRGLIPYLVHMALPEGWVDDCTMDVPRYVPEGWTPPEEITATPTDAATS